MRLPMKPRNEGNFCRRILQKKSQKSRTFLRAQKLINKQRTSEKINWRAHTFYDTRQIGSLKTEQLNQNNLKKLQEFKRNFYVKNETWFTGE
jgi:hypothetical protein